MSLKTRLAVAQFVAFGIAIAIAAPKEFQRIATQPDRQHDSLGWLEDFNIHTTLYFILLVLLPVFWLTRTGFVQRRRWQAVIKYWLSDKPEQDKSVRGSSGCAWLLATLVGLTSLSVSAGIASYQLNGADAKRFGDLPPAYHDEYSYLFQAKTFLAGRLWFPSHPTSPRLFDQMHVLNEGRFASRYFPGTGLWIAPFLAAGNPYWGHWLAGAIASMLVFATGRELSSNGVGFLAGLLTAASPGMALFSNLLLAHHPTLVGVTLFVFAFIRMQRTEKWTYALLAGIGLGFAMFCRPMTAAGIGLPFAIGFVWWLNRNQTSMLNHSLRPRIVLTAMLGMPVLLGLLCIYGYNRAITGNGWTTPYQVYLDIYTPRHVYGFNNVIRGEKRLGPRVLKNYDEWAENLTPALAVRNTRTRLIASWQWTLGIIPLAMASAVFLIAGSTLDARWWYLPAAILSLFAVHVPYWFVGIMHWHYVFESSPLWLLLFSAATSILVRHWHKTNRRWMPVWWCGLIAAGLLVSYVPVGPAGLVELEIKNIAFSRQKYDAFQKTIQIQVTNRPALVLIDFTDPHIDFVVNNPNLNSDVLYARFRPGVTQLSKVMRQFPNRTCYQYRAQDKRLFPIMPDP